MITADMSIHAPVYRLEGDYAYQLRALTFITLQAFNLTPPMVYHRYEANFAFTAFVHRASAALVICLVLSLSSHIPQVNYYLTHFKRAEYECGYGSLQTVRFLPYEVHFYVVGLLFLIFDVEVASLVPGIVEFERVGWETFRSLAVFLWILTYALYYEYCCGGLSWPRRDARLLGERARQVVRGVRLRLKLAQMRPQLQVYPILFSIGADQTSLLYNSSGEVLESYQAYGVIVALVLSTLIVYWLILAGWASQSKYAFLALCDRPRR